MLTTWNTHTAQIIDALDTDTFPERLSNALRSISEIDFIVIFGYVGKTRPLALYNDFPPDQERVHVVDYQAGPYLLDPFFLAATDGVRTGLWRLNEIAPDRFYQGEYYRSYYAQTGLAEEVGFLIKVHEGMTVVVSLMRKSRKFSKTEMKLLQTASPVVDAACRRQWRNTRNDAHTQSNLAEASIERAFRKIGEGVLTPREHEVVELTLRGHSADAIGKLLKISTGTIRIHRRNIYAKLRISSQGELFSAFISTIVDAPPKYRRAVRNAWQLKPARVQ